MYRCATQLSFSHMVVVGLQTMGTRLSTQEREDYTHLWRYIGHLIGVLPPMNACTSYAATTAYMESILMHIVAYDDSSVRCVNSHFTHCNNAACCFALPSNATRHLHMLLLLLFRLAHNVIQSMTNNKPMYWSFARTAQLSRMLLGDHVGDLLKLPRSSWQAYYHLFVATCVRAVARLTYLPWLGPHILQGLRALIPRLVEVGLGGERTTLW